jgi:hypothetical protein
MTAGITFVPLFAASRTASSVDFTLAGGGAAPRIGRRADLREARDLLLGLLAAVRVELGLGGGLLVDEAVHADLLYLAAIDALLVLVGLAVHLGLHPALADRFDDAALGVEAVHD